MKQVILITLSGYTDYNVSLIEQIKKTSDIDVILAWDKKGINIDIKEDELNIINNCDELFKKYGEKIKNFNGRWEDNPAKLGVLHWFSQNEKYDFMWVFEDDVYVKNCKEFIDCYSNHKTDIICKHDSKLPFWYPGYRVGDKNLLSRDKDFVYSHLYIVRYSKKACKDIINEIVESDETNHHELWIPYVTFKKELSHSNLLSKHLSGLRTNPTSNTKNSFSKISHEICHPYKHKLVQSN